MNDSATLIKPANDYALELRRKFPLINNNDSLVYLDNGATTQKPDCVIKAAMDYYKTTNANVHRGIYELSEKATHQFERVRSRCANYLRCRSEEIIFTKGTTDSINILAYSLTPQIKKGDEILLSIMEHHANLVPWQQLAKRTGAVLKFIGLTPSGELDMDSYCSQLSDKTKIVAITHLSNVLGTIVDVKKISSLAHDQNALVVVDGAQAVAHMRVDLNNLDCDFYAFSAHKMYGPTGVGVLYGKKHLLEALEPSTFGGSMISTVGLISSTWNDSPHKFEAGTPNIEGVITFGETLSFLASLDWKKIKEHEHDLCSSVIRELSALPEITVFGPFARGPVISFAIEDIHPHDVAELLDNDGIAVRAGHHCAMPLMNHLGVSATTRVSFGIYNTIEEAEKFIVSIKKIVAFSKQASATNPDVLSESELTQDQEIYKENILDHYRHPRNFGKPISCSVSHEEHNPLCGDRLEFFLTISPEGMVDDILFHGKGCAISQATASLISEEIKGKPLSDVRAFSKEDIIELLGIPIGPVRMKCALLSLKAINKSLDKYEEQQC